MKVLTSLPFIYACAIAALLVGRADSSRIEAAEIFIDPMFGVSVTENITYGIAPIGGGPQAVPGGEGFKSLQLDLYQPTGANLPNELPAIVIMHGGGFAGSEYARKSPHFERMAMEFAERGYVVASISYRYTSDLAAAPGDPLSLDTDRFPNLSNLLSQQGSQLGLGGPMTEAQYLHSISAAVEDQARAVNWLVDNAATYHIDPDKIAVSGYSAGAISSLLLGAGAVEQVDAPVAAVFAVSGAMFGAEAFIDQDDPAMFLLHGRKDGTVPYRESVAVEAALNNVGIASALFSVDAGHDLNALLNALWSGDQETAFFQFMLNALSAPDPSDMAVQPLEQLLKSQQLAEPLLFTPQLLQQFGELHQLQEQMQQAATAAEPSTIMLALLALMSLISWRRSRRTS